MLLVMNPMTWDDARDYCRSMRMDLAAIETGAENTFVGEVRNHVAGEEICILSFNSRSNLSTPQTFSLCAGSDTYYWIGGNDLNDEGSYKWVKTGKHFVFSVLSTTS